MLDITLNIYNAVSASFGVILYLLIVVGLFIMFRNSRKRVSHKIATTYQGAIVIVDAGRRVIDNRYQINRVIFGYDKSTLRPVAVGNVVARQGTQLRIALSGDWERVSENAIKGMVSFVQDHSGAWTGKTEWVFTIGEEFPVGSIRHGRFVGIVGPDSYRLRVLQIYVPEDSISS